MLGVDLVDLGAEREDLVGLDLDVARVPLEPADFVVNSRGSGSEIELPPKVPANGDVSIGAPGFEPGTSPTRTVRATRLRHAPIGPVSHTVIGA